MNQYSLSYSTVSRALQDLARDGYITRVMGSGSIVANSAGAKLREPLTVHLIDGIPESKRKGLQIFQELLEAGRELGLKIVPHEDQTQSERAACIDAALARNPTPAGLSEGFVFPYFAGNRDHIDRLQKLGVPYVVMDVPLNVSGYNIVLRDHRAAARSMVERLLRAGHKPQCVGLLLGTIDFSDPDAYQWDQAKAAGAADALGGCDSLRTIWNVAPTIEDGACATRDLLARAPCITAIFCDNADKASGACNAVVAAGKRVPDDVSIACINAPRQGGSPALSHAWAPAEGVGHAAAAILIELIIGKMKAPLVREVAMHFGEGATIVPPPPK